MYFSHVDLGWILEAGGWEGDDRLKYSICISGSFSNRYFDSLFDQTLIIGVKLKVRFELWGNPHGFDSSSKVMNLVHAVLFRWAHWNGTLIYLAGVLCFPQQRDLLWKMQFPFGTISALYRGSVSIHFFYLFFRETKFLHCEHFNLWRIERLFMKIYKLEKC